MPSKAPEGLSESWGTDSGLPDDVDVYFEEVWFGKNPQAKEQKDKLFFGIRGEASRDGEVVEDELTVFYSCGDSWTATKGGLEASHANGKTRFMDSSNMGKLIAAIAGLPDAVAELRSRAGETYQADTFKGLGFHMERSDFPFVRNGVETVYSVLLPTSFLGVKEGAAPTKAAGTAKKAAGTKKPAAGATKKPAPKKTSSALRDEVIAYAKEYEAEDHDTFMSAVVDAEYFPKAEEVALDEELMNEILDPESELWTSAH